VFVFCFGCKITHFQKNVQVFIPFFIRILQKKCERPRRALAFSKYVLLNINFTGVVFTSLNPRDLKQIVADPDSGIMTRGEHSHKIWVERK